VTNIICPKACGECCKVITLNNYRTITWQEHWQKQIDKESKWFLKHLRQISFKEAVKLRPILADFNNSYVNYFICDYFNYETNKCNGYDKYRPRMCTKFPFYDDVVIDGLKYKNLPDCYYINQIMLYK